ncbi:MAG: VWA domain-containing protein [Eubacterium sp.]|nr:VWA domain-containing protein [Eubacterium sp.]
MITKPIVPLYIMIPVVSVAFLFYLIVVIRNKTGVLNKILRAFRILLILGLIFLINLRIMTKRYNVDVELKNIDVLFVVDSTISMWAEDYDGQKPRMKGVQNDCAYIMDSLSGSNFALIKFDNKAQILAPFTQDSKNVADAFSTISIPDKLYAKGTTLNVPYKEMEEMLVSSSKKEGRITIVFFISDGEITSDEQLESFSGLANLIDGGAVLGYGTPQGGRMQDKGYGYINDPEKGGEALSKYDEDNLKQLSRDMHIDYIHMEESINVEYLLDAIKSGSVSKLGSSDNVSYEDTFFYYVPFLLAMLLVEIVLVIRRGRI